MFCFLNIVGFMRLGVLRDGLENIFRVRRIGVGSFLKVLFFGLIFSL